MKRNLYYEDEIVKNSFKPYMLKRLLKYCKKYKGQAIGMIAVGVIYAVLGTMPSIALMLIVTVFRRRARRYLRTLSFGRCGFS